jgi:hypothetical protein
MPVIVIVIVAVALPGGEVCCSVTWLCFPASGGMACDCVGDILAIMANAIISPTMVRILMVGKFIIARV